MLAFVSMTHSITTLPAEFLTAIEILSHPCRYVWCVCQAAHESIFVVSQNSIFAPVSPNSKLVVASAPLRWDVKGNPGGQIASMSVVLGQTRYGLRLQN